MSKLDQYKKFHATKATAKEAVVKALAEYEFPSIEVRVSNFVEQLGEELSRSAMQEHIEPEAPVSKVAPPVEKKP